MNADAFIEQIKQLEQKLHSCLQDTNACHKIIEQEVKNSKRVQVNFEFPYAPKTMYTTDSPHTILFDIINQKQENYIQLLNDLYQHVKKMQTIPLFAENDTSPCWKNGYFSSMDAACLYSFLIEKKPSVLLEIGSGNSTKFAKQAVLEHHLGTKIISIDPHPRSEIDQICDKIIRSPLENTNIDTFTSLQHDAIVLVDNSHRSFQNSDVTVFFLNIFPILPPGVTVIIHDIFLPYDYPKQWNVRYYNEQYLLACYLLGGCYGYEIILPIQFMIQNPQIVNNKIIQDFIEFFKVIQAPFHGSSFYLQKKNR